MNISNQRIRVAIDTSQMGTINDVLTGATPQFWNGVDLQFELAIFYGATLASVSNLDSITVDLKASDPRTGLPLMSQTLASGSLNAGLTLNAWQGGASSDCHALMVFTNAQTNLFLANDSETFWLVISALTNDSPAHKIVLGATPLNVVEGGDGVTPPAPVVTPIYYTAAQSDARYTLAVNLTSINTSIATLNTEVAAVTTTASAAMPKAGGTFSGAITVTGLSGVLKAPSGVVTGSATTSDLPEGTNLYYTSARFTAALAAVSGAASGVCPLNGSSLIPAAYLPPNAFVSVSSVSSQAAMLALSVTQGAIAIRTDTNTTFILTNNTPTVLGNWSQFLSQPGAVSGVNSLTGNVTLTTALVPEITNLYFTTAHAAAAAIAATLTGFSNATGGNVTAGDSVLTALGRLENRCALNDAKVTGSDRLHLSGDTMTGALLFSGTTNPGIILNNLTDAQRASLPPINGTLIYNSTLSLLEFCSGAVWQPLVGHGGGTTLLSGAGAPGGIGVNGNYYLDTTTGNISLLSSGSWSVIWAPTPVEIGGVQVVGARQTGWTAATGTDTRTTFVTSTVTLQTLAEHVKALIDDLMTHGLIGT